MTSIAGQMQIYVPKGSAAVPVAANQALGEQAFLGRDIRGLARDPNPDPGCKFVGTDQLRCIYWSEVGILYSQGRLVKITAHTSGKVKSVSVSQLHKLIGIAFGTDA